MSQFIKIKDKTLKIKYEKKTHFHLRAIDIFNNRIYKRANERTLGPGVEKNRHPPGTGPFPAN
ncbi:MAG: hypothetical protein COV66_09650 [Nitrospinae bacterium CG11_big_fil_rev_8_21_14_0_20_45_15]|nr:MAG: hypothetical protein COV66_09650 [Nitrospinae bacterium CG11_big_fil_rev_8_21_14_0_20_45_15]